MHKIRSWRRHFPMTDKVLYRVPVWPFQEQLAGCYHSLVTYSTAGFPKKLHDAALGAKWELALTASGPQAFLRWCKCNAAQRSPCRPSNTTQGENPHISDAGWYSCNISHSLRPYSDLPCCCHNRGQACNALERRLAKVGNHPLPAWKITPKNLAPGARYNLQRLARASPLLLRQL